MLIFKQNCKKIISITCLLILIALAGWFIYQKYLKPTYNLADLLPNDYQISLELSLDHYNFPALEQKNLLENIGINSIYQQITQQLDNSLNQLQNNEARNIIKSSKQGLIFFENPQTFGLILKLPFTQNSKKIAETNFQPLFSTVIKGDILVLTNNQKLLTKIGQPNISSKINPYLSFTFNPWLKISLNKSFFEEKYNYPVIAELQQIMLPLNFSQSNSYNLELDNQKSSLNFKLTPQKQLNQNGDLQSFITLIDEKAKFALGLNNLPDITKELENNKNFQAMWSQLDNQLFLNQQLSLAKLSKTIKNPVIVAFGENFWQIITDKAEEPLVKTVLTNYLAQFKPKEVRKILPDGSRSIELVADPKKVIWQTQENNGNSLNYQNTASGKLGWLVSNDKLIISNQLDKISIKNISFSCGTDKKSPISDIFYLNPEFSKLNLKTLLANFSYFSGVSYNDGEIRLCLGLK